MVPGEAGFVPGAGVVDGLEPGTVAGFVPGVTGFVPGVGVVDGVEPGTVAGFVPGALGVEPGVVPGAVEPGGLVPEAGLPPVLVDGFVG